MMRLAQNTLGHSDIFATVLRWQVRINILRLARARHEPRVRAIGVLLEMCKTKKSQLSYSDEGYMDIVLEKTVQHKTKYTKYREGVININKKNKESSHMMSCANPSASIHVKAKKENPRINGPNPADGYPAPKVPSRTPR